MLWRKGVFRDHTGGLVLLIKLAYGCAGASGVEIGRSLETKEPQYYIFPMCLPLTPLLVKQTHLQRFHAPFLFATACASSLLHRFPTAWNRAHGHEISEYRIGPSAVKIVTWLTTFPTRMSLAVAACIWRLCRVLLPGGQGVG